MRARKKKNIDKRLERCQSYLSDKILTSEKPVHVEIGCGKGRFIIGMAKKFNYMFYALEKVPDVIVMAIEKAAELKALNLKFIIADALDLSDNEKKVFVGKTDGKPVFEIHERKGICPLNSIDVLYLNFSDPWPKKNDMEKRLTYRTFLEQYKKILKPDGRIEFKTDNKKLFDFSKEELCQSGFILYDITEDLHNSKIENHFMTEYESRFSEQGLPIYHFKAKVK